MTNIRNMMQRQKWINSDVEFKYLIMRSAMTTLLITTIDQKTINELIILIDFYR